MELPEDLNITTLDLARKSLIKIPDLSKYTNLTTININY